MSQANISVAGTSAPTNIQVQKEGGVATGGTDPALYWQCMTESCCDRLKHLKNTNALTDVILKFQPTGEIKAHSLVLAMTSPVFERMLYGDFQKKNGEGEKVVEIEDVTFHTFQFLHSYIYDGDIYLGTISEALDLHKAADMYLMDHLKTKCIEFMLSIMTFRTALPVLEYAIFISNDNLQDVALRLIREQTRHVLSSGLLNHLNLDTIKVVLTEIRSVPIVREISLFTVLMDWSMNKIKSPDEAVKDLGVYWTVKELYKLIRFERMSPTEFGSCAQVDMLFHNSDALEILRFLNGCGNELPSILSNKATMPVCDKLERHLFPFDFEGTRVTSEVTKAICYIKIKATFDFSMVGLTSPIEGRVEVGLDVHDSSKAKVLISNVADLSTGGRSVDLLFEGRACCKANQQYRLTLTFWKSSKPRGILNYESFASEPMSEFHKEFKQGLMCGRCDGAIPKIRGSLFALILEI